MDNFREPKSLENEQIRADRKKSRHVNDDLTPKTAAGVYALNYRDIAFKYNGNFIVALAEPRNPEADFAVELIVSNLAGDTYVDLRLDNEGKTVSCTTVVAGRGFIGNPPKEDPYMSEEAFHSILEATFPKGDYDD